MEAVAEEMEEKEVGYDGGQGECGAKYFGEVEGVKDNESGEEQERREDVGEKDGEEAVTGVGEEGDCLAWMILLPVAGGDGDDVFFLVDEAAFGTCGTRSAGAGLGDADFDETLGDMKYCCGV